MICQQADSQKLGRTGIHEKRHTKCPGQAITGFSQEDTKADTQE